MIQDFTPEHHRGKKSEASSVEKLRKAIIDSSNRLYNYSKTRDEKI
jgi:hypothetical protein